MGDLGPEATRFLDWTAEAGQRLWQILPLGPTGGANSPYSGISSFAGNPWLISPQRLAQRGWLSKNTLGAAQAPTAAVAYERVIPERQRLLIAAWQGFRHRASSRDVLSFEAFCDNPQRREWLEDWVQFVALRKLHQLRPWTSWREELRRRERSALRQVSVDFAEELSFQRFVQFVFHQQWGALRRSANQRGIEVIGDLPFYPAHDSADVWAHPEVFQLDDQGQPQKVAGVPPDYFSEHGQLWGNPLYDWERLRQDGYAWWIRRLQATLEQVDVVRLDHFRAFSDFWEVEATATTAAGGHWAPGPGDALFQTVRQRLGALPLIAEDLGDITDAVNQLRDRWQLPGMKVLQFGVGDPDNEHHPNHHVERAVVYTGTHDNDTIRGWWNSLDASRRERVLQELQCDAESVAAGLVELAWSANCERAVVPMQDLIGLGSEARMNVPGTPRGNWRWRLGPGLLTLKLAERLRRATEANGRL